MALITPLQTTGARSESAVASLAKAFDFDVTAGSVLVVFEGAWFTGDAGTVSDSQGNTYTARGSVGKTGIWTATASTSGPCTVTVTANSGTIPLSIGLAEIPAGTYTFTPSLFKSQTGTSLTSNDLVVTVDGAAVFAMMTCQGDPSGVVAEDAAWTLISEAESFTFGVRMPYSWIWRNRDIGTHQAAWTVGASMTGYMRGLVVEGVPDPTVTKGSAVFGVNTTVKAARAIAFGLDGAVNIHDTSGQFKVFGDTEVTGTVTAGSVPTGTVALGDLSDVILMALAADDTLTYNGTNWVNRAAVVKYAEVAIGSAELLALRATPKTLVAAPGAGKVLEFIGAVLLLDATATAYVESAANLGVKYTNGSGVQVSETIEATGFIDQTTDTLTTARAKLDAIAAKAGCENQALVLHNLGAGEYTTGTGVMRVKIAVRQWSTGW